MRPSAPAVASQPNDVFDDSPEPFAHDTLYIVRVFAFEYQYLSPSISLFLVSTLPYTDCQIIRSTGQVLAIRRERNGPNGDCMSFEGADGRPVVCTAVVSIDMNGVVVRGGCQYLFVHHDERR
jgi:hypothetical protein